MLDARSLAAAPFETPRRSTSSCSTSCTSAPSADEGTFDAAIPHLAELAELGVTAIEIMPVAEFPGARGWGYDGVYLSAAQSLLRRPGGAGRGWSTPRTRPGSP